MTECDVVILGAGAAGLFCAGAASRHGLRVLVIDHSERVAEKVRISGGGRCNFTNRDLDVRAPQQHFVSENPQFCRSALSRYTPQQFIELVCQRGIAFHEKHKGQLFCDQSAQDIIQLLLDECGPTVQRWQPARVQAVVPIPAPTDTPTAQRFRIETDRGAVCCKALVVATGGLSIPKIGATDLGYRLAKQFGLSVVATRPALVPLTFDAQHWTNLTPLAGLSLPARISTGEKKHKVSFVEDLLFTHKGLSGPGILQISSYWKPGTAIEIDCLPDLDLEAALLAAKQSSRKRVVNELAQWLPARLADAACEGWLGPLSADTRQALQRPVCEAPDKALQQLAQAVQHWPLIPSGTEGYAKAEATAGGVNTKDLSQQTMQARHVPGLYFIGEVVDITGWLGGYNFQWAWSSAHACAQALAQSLCPPDAVAATQPA